jgi:WD40 repeat protein
MTHFNYYQPGGSLVYQHPSYVVRQADTDLYRELLNGNLCYVFNSRQMGKSSLRVQIMKQLNQQGVKCAAIDLSPVNNHVTPSEWYNGFISSLLGRFSLSKKVDFSTWRRQHEFLPPNQQLIQLIDDVILKEFSGKIVIFIDEIDSILRMDFKDDFFALIRYFHNQIIDNQEYQRLTFCLLGVATPSDLVSDQNRTPFNVGSAIELTGFKFSEVESLIRGLEGIVARPEVVMEEILKWTGGQPFLTQKLCKLICISEEEFPAYHEIECIEKLVRTNIIENWETKDDPEHLRTIRKSLLQKYQNQAGRLLGLYQQILTRGEIPADDSPEQTQLRLTGLVVRQQGKLRVYNGIYAEVFNQAWVEKELANIRPYAESFKAWIASNCQDELYLLRGKNLQNARIWAENKGVSDLDRKFLDTSQELEKREIQKRLQAEAESSKILAEANEALVAANQKSEQIIKKSQRLIKIGRIVLGISLVVAVITGIFVNTIVQVEKIKSLTTSSDALLNSNKELDALVTSLKAANQLELTTWADTNAKETVRLALQRVVYKIGEGVREQNRIEKHNDGVRSVNFSPDGRYIVTASEDSTVRLWGIDGKEIKKIPVKNQFFRSAIFSPDSKAIAAITANNTIKVWGIDGREIITIKGQDREQYMSGISFTPDGKFIAAPSQDNKVNLVKFWNIQGQLIKTFSGHQYNIWSISCSPDSKTIATADLGGTVKIWSIDGREIKTFKAGENSIFGVSFSPDGNTIATAGGDNTVRLWNLEGKEIRTLGKHNNSVISVSFSPDGKTIASASADKTVKLWSLDGKELNTLRGHSYYVFSASFSPDGKMIASASADNTVKLWNINEQEPKTFIGHNSALWGVSFSPDGKTIASAGYDKIIKLWSIDVQKPKSITTDNSSEWNAIWSLNFSPDGKTIATANHDRTIKLWDVNSQKNIKTFTGHTQEVRDVNFSPDGQTLVSASYDGTVKLWDINGQEIRTLNANAGKLFSANFSPNGQTIVSGHNDGTVRLWNLQGQNFKTIPAHNSYVTDVRFSPDGKIIGSASQDKTIKLWNLDGKEIRTLKGQNAGITRFSFSPDSKILASASADGTIKLWQIKDGLELKTIEGRGYPIWHLSFSPDGKKIASVSDDGLVELWNTETLDFDQLIVRGCSWLHDYLKNNSSLRENDKYICKQKYRT